MGTLVKDGGALQTSRSGEGEENLSMLCDLFMTNWLLSFSWMSGVSCLGKAHSNIRPWESLTLLPVVTQSGRSQGPTPNLQQENTAKSVEWSERPAACEAGIPEFLARDQSSDVMHLKFPQLSLK